MSSMEFLEKLLDGVAIDWLPLGEITKYEQPTKYLVAAKNYGSMPFCVELDNLKDTDAPIHQPAAMLVAAD